jgi:hypothetical protein
VKNDQKTYLKVIKKNAMNIEDLPQHEQVQQES